MNERKLFFFGLSLALASGFFFLIDLQLPLGIAAGVPYVAVVLFAAWMPDRRIMILISSFCSVLVLIGFFWSPPGGMTWMVLANRVLAILAIWMVALLSLYRQRAEARRLESLHRLQAILETAGDGVVACNHHGRIEMFNPAAEKLFGWSAAEAFGKSIHELLPEWGNSLPDEAAPVQRELFAHRRDGILFPAELTVSSTSLDRQLLYTAFVRDITERRLAEERLRQINEELNAFVRTVSHDLRSPLAPILGFADYLLEEFGDCLREEGAVAVAEIESQGRRMLAMLEDLLQLAMVGEVARPIQPVDVDEVVREVVEAHRAAAEEAGTELICAPLPPAPIPGSLLAQVFHNLIGNAVRYAARPGGKIEIGGGGQDGLISYFVRDNGPGIPPGEREQIFNIFYRGQAGRGITGSGIGLAIVSKIVRLYQGRLWMEETPGGGATFRIELPAEK